MSIVVCLLKNGELLESTDHVTVDGAAGTVNFSQVMKSDEGTYMCTAVNDAGNDSHTAQLVVRGTLPMFCRPASNINP